MWSTLVAAALAAPAPGLHREVLDVDGAEIRYTLSMPAHEGDARHPIVLALHYGGPVSPWYGAGVVEQLVEPGLRALAPIVVAPDCPGKGWSDPKSDAAAMAVLDHALATLPADPARVVVVGFSMGGHGTWSVASRHPDRFSAAIPVAGNPSGATDAIARVPLYVLHARQDEVVPIAPAEAKVAELRAAGVDVQYRVVEDLTHYQTASYAPHLAQAVPWLTALWARQPAPSATSTESGQ